MLNSFPTNSGEEVQKFRTFYACIIGSWPLYACFFLSVVRTSNFKKDFRPAYAFFCGHFMVALTLCVNASKPWPFGRIIPVFCIGHFMPVSWPGPGILVTEDTIICAGGEKRKWIMQWF